MSSEPAAAAVRSDLQAESIQLVQQLAELGIGEDADMRYDANFADTSQVMAERGEAEALGNSLKGRLEQVDHALEKIDAGTFGVCEQCGNEIPAARLEAMPTGRFCMSCASAAP